MIGNRRCREKHISINRDFRFTWDVFSVKYHQNKTKKQNANVQKVSKPLSKKCHENDIKR